MAVFSVGRLIWHRVRALLDLAQTSQAYGYRQASMGERQLRLQRARHELFELLDLSISARKSVPLELDRFSTVDELALLYGPLVFEARQRGPQTVDAVTYLSGVPAFEAWLEAISTREFALPGARQRDVLFDDVGRGLVIRIDTTSIPRLRLGLHHGRAVHLRHDTVDSVTVLERARTPVLDEQDGLAGGFVGGRLFGRFGAAVGSMSGLERSEAIGSAVLTISGHSKDRAYRLTFAVLSTRLDPVRYFFAKLYRGWFQFVEEGTAPTFPASTPSVASDPATLASLHARGILSDDEYEAAMARVLRDPPPAD